MLLLRGRYRISIVKVPCHDHAEIVRDFLVLVDERGNLKRVHERPSVLCVIEELNSEVLLSE